MNKTGKMKKRQLIHPIIYQTKKKQKPIETRKSTDNSNPSRKSRKIIETRNIKLMIDEIEQDVKKYLNRVKSKKRSMKDENSKKHQFEQQKFEQTEKSSSSTTTTIKEEKTKKEQKELKENPSSIIRSSVLSSSQNQFKSSKSTSKIYFPSESLQMSNFNSHPRSSLLHAFQLAEQINFTNHHLEQSQMTFLEQIQCIDPTIVQIYSESEEINCKIVVVFTSLLDGPYLSIFVNPFTVSMISPKFQYRIEPGSGLLTNSELFEMDQTMIRIVENVVNHTRAPIGNFHLISIFSTICSFCCFYFPQISNFNRTNQQFNSLMIENNLLSSATVQTQNTRISEESIPVLSESNHDLQLSISSDQNQFSSIEFEQSNEMDQKDKY